MGLPDQREGEVDETIILEALNSLNIEYHRKTLRSAMHYLHNGKIISGSMYVDLLAGKLKLKNNPDYKFTVFFNEHLSTSVDK